MVGQLRLTVSQTPTTAPQLVMLHLHAPDIGFARMGAVHCMTLTWIQGAPARPGPKPSFHVHAGETPQLSGNPFAAIGSFVGGVFGAGARRVRSLRKVVWQVRNPWECWVQRAYLGHGPVLAHTMLI